MTQAQSDPGSKNRNQVPRETEGPQVCGQEPFGVHRRWEPRNTRNTRKKRSTRPKVRTCAAGHPSGFTGDGGAGGGAWCDAGRILRRESRARGADAASTPDRDTGRKYLKAAIAAARAELTERLALVQAREERDRLLAVQDARVSVNADCMKRQRYMRENINEYHAVLLQLRGLQEMRLRYQGLLGRVAGHAASAGPGTGSGAVSDLAQEVENRSEAGATEVVGGPGGETASAATVVARSPDLATPVTDGLAKGLRSATGDRRSRRGGVGRPAPNIRGFGGTG
jgi:hypothetical protein